MQRIWPVCIAVILMLSLVACGAPAVDTAPGTASTPAVSATATPEPAPTPAPVPFSYENVFNEIFSDAELAKLYPGIGDYGKERTRISGNISRIEDFEFYKLTAEQQEFIREAQAGNIEESSVEELREVLTKIYEKDPYVFDDVDNEVKIDNRIESVIPDLKRINVDTSTPTFYGSTEDVLTTSNGGFTEIVSRETVWITAGTNVNKNYFYATVLPDYNNNNWKANYSVFDFSKFLLDGSEGQKIARKLYEANVKFYSSEKKDVEKGLKEFLGECLNILLINDALQKPGGINSVSSKMHYAIIYNYCFTIIYFISDEIAPDITYSVPDEYADEVGLPNNELNLSDIRILMEKYLGSKDSIFNNAVEELQQAQEKYS